VIDEPKTSPYGGVVAAPAFHSIALNSLAYLKVVPQVAVARAPKPGEAKQPSAPPPQAMSEGDALDVAVTGEVMPDFRGMSMRKVLQVMEKRSINIKLKGSGRAMEQNPPPGHAIKGVDEVWVRFAPSA